VVVADMLAAFVLMVILLDNIALTTLAGTGATL
jgi:hypothetical protein